MSGQLAAMIAHVSIKYRLLFWDYSWDLQWDWHTKLVYCQAGNCPGYAGNNSSGIFYIGKGVGGSGVNEAHVQCASRLRTDYVSDYSAYDNRSSNTANDAYVVGEYWSGHDGNAQGLTQGIFYMDAEPSWYGGYHGQGSVYNGTRLMFYFSELTGVYFRIIYTQLVVQPTITMSILVV